MIVQLIFAKAAPIMYAAIAALAHHLVIAKMSLL
jgi:hypothetical protein